MIIETPEEREAVRQVCELIARLSHDGWKNVHTILKTAVDAPQANQNLYGAARVLCDRLQTASLDLDRVSPGTMQAWLVLRQALDADSCRRNAAIPAAHPEGRFASRPDTSANYPKPHEA